MDETGAESVLERLRPKLIEVFKSDSKALADLMHSKGFLSNDDHETVTEVGSMLSKSERARIMADSLIRKVRINPENYQNFLQLVQPHKQQFGDVVYLLERDNAEIKKEVEIRYQKEMTRELGSDDAKEVLTALIKVRGNYEFVGLYWKIPKYEIDSIKGANIFQPMPCLLACINYWLNHNTKKIKDAPPINLQSVIGALRHVSVGGEAVAMDVERELRERIEKDVRKDIHHLLEGSPSAFEGVSPALRSIPTDSDNKRVMKIKQNSGLSGASASKRLKATVDEGQEMLANVHDTEDNSQSPKTESRLIEDSEKIARSIEKKGTVKRKTAHIMIIGFPGSGKSHLLDNLLEQKRDNNSSTGISDSVVAVDVTGKDISSHSTVFGQGSSWNKDSFENSIVNQLQHCDKQAIPDENQRNTDSATVQDDKQLPQLEKQDLLPQHSTATKPEPTASLQNNISRVLELSNIMSYEKLESTFSLYIRDTGGQVEFQEVLSILINGPSIFFFVIKVNLSLDEPLTLEYRKGKDVIDRYESTTTTRQALVQTLTTIQNTDEPTDIATHSSVVFIIGTHTDKIEPRESKEEKISKLNAELHDLIASHKFELVEYQDEKSKTVIFPVSNTHFESEKFKAIQKRVNQKIEGTDAFTIEYPLGYLLFSLALQHCKDDVLNRTECEDIAAKFQITGDEEVTKMLKILHHRIGIIQFYNIDGLKDLVIIKPEVLFNKLTELMVKTFPSFNGCLPKTKTDLLKGIIKASELKQLFTENNKMKPKEFITFLEHLRIAASFYENDENEKYFFIPSVINHSQEKNISEEAKSKICPLAITFKSSCCPKGVFGMTVCHFMSKEKKENQYTFSLVKENIYRDIVGLKMYSSGELQGKVFLCQFQNTHIEVHFCPDEDEDFKTLSSLCNQIRTTLMEGIRQSLPKLNYKENRVGATESLKCHTCQKLHKKETKTGKVSVICSSRLYPGKCCSCWFDQVETPASSIVVEDCGAGIQQVPTTDNIIASDKGSSIDLNFKNIFQMLYPARASWYNIGVMLDVDNDQLAAFEKDNDNVDKKLGAVINHWWCNSNNKSWTELAEAMGSDVVGRNNIKTKIMELIT